jgi:hypothetical protein
LTIEATKPTGSTPGMISIFCFFHTDADFNPRPSASKKLNNRPTQEEIGRSGSLTAF